VSASYHGAFERLEPDEVNISSPVLRGRRAGNGPLLPDLLRFPQQHVFQLGEKCRIIRSFFFTVDLNS
jgi:hypothetical protein